MIDELMAEGYYDKALEQLADLSDEDVRYKRLICLNRLERYEEAAAEAVFARTKANNTYYNVVAEYLTALKGIRDYETAVNVLLEELEMPYIPYEYESLFNAVYDEILEDKREANEIYETKNTIFSPEEIASLLKRDNVNEDLLYMALDQLQQVNVRLLTNDIAVYLADESRPAFAKTLIMETMITQQVDEDFDVRKNGEYFRFNPAISAQVLERECYRGIGGALVRALEDDNPALMHQCLDYLEYVLYATYPREYYDDEYNVMAAAIHYYVASMQGIEVTEDDLGVLYYVNMDEVETAVLALREIE